METQSIANIKARRAEIKEELKKVRTHNFGGEKFGSEGEFTDRSVIAGIEAILVDVDALCGAPAKFLKNSTGQERKTISALFDQLLNHCTNLDLANAVNVIEQIKPIFRSLGIRGSDDRRIAFENHIDDLQKKSISLSLEIEKLRQAKQTSEAELEKTLALLEEANKKISNINENSSSISSVLDTAYETKDRLAEITNECLSKMGGIEEIKAGAESSRTFIDEFSKKIAQREIQLENQAERTKEYIATLALYKEEQISTLDEAASLIESAKMALGYKTAEGLSAAFTEKHKEAKSDKSTIFWIIAAALFVAGAIGIGVWVTLDSGTAIELIVGRISLIPILIGGAWFSASQYIKQKNIAEEYAYKSVLVRSMVGFSEQISGSNGKGEDHSHYIRDVLSEIHMNPIRKQDKPENQKASGEIIDLLKEIKGPLEKLIDKSGH